MRIITTIMNLMTYDIGGVTILGEGFSYGLALMAKKICNDSQKNNKDYSFFTQLYDLIEACTFYIADEYYKQKNDIILETAEMICKKWIENRSLSFDLLSETLGNVLTEYTSEDKCFLWMQKFAEGIIKDDELKNYFQFETINNIQNTVIDTNNRMKCVEETLKNIILYNDKGETIKIAYPVFQTDLPPALTDYFVGRKALLEEIIDDLIHGNSCYLYNIGGIGKTEIAKRVVQILAQTLIVDTGIEYIAWINYQKGDFRLSLCKSFLLTCHVEDINQAWKKVFQLLQQYGEKILLVVDNIEGDVEDDFKELLQYTKCRFLLTSRWDGLYSLKRYIVNELTPSECLKIFYHNYKKEKNDFIADEIMQLADYHTVMIELLAKIAEIEEWPLEVFKRKLIDAGFGLSEEEA